MPYMLAQGRATGCSRTQHAWGTGEGSSHVSEGFTGSNLFSSGCIMCVRQWSRHRTAPAAQPGSSIAPRGTTRSASVSQAPPTPPRSLRGTSPRSCGVLIPQLLQPLTSGLRGGSCFLQLPLMCFSSVPFQILQASNVCSIHFQC